MQSFFYALARIGLLFYLLTVLLSCKNEVNLNAPAKDILVVYGILNPDANIQFLRVSKVFLPLTDALEYAAQNDLSLRSSEAEVRLNGVLLRDTFMIRSAGIFPEGQNLFYLTDADLKIEPGAEYTLEINYLPNPDANIKATTHVPARPAIISPEMFRYAGGTLIRNVEVAFENVVKVTLSKSQHAAAYEIRVRVNYQESGNPKTSLIGPKIFSTNTRCTETSASAICYQFERREIIDYLKSAMNTSQYYYTIIDTPETKPVDLTQPVGPQREGLNNSVYISLTALDEPLYLYLLANNANSSTLATSTLEYTNVENGLGILGSVSSNGVYVDFTPCGKYLLGFNNTPKPPGRCE